MDGLFDDAHNIFLQIGATGGIPLLLLFFLLIVMPVAQGLNRLRSGEDWIVVGLVAALGGFLATASFTPIPILGYILLMVLLAALVFPKLQSANFSSFLSGRRAAAVLLGGLLIIYGASYYAAQVFFFHAYRNFQQRDFSKARSLIQTSIRLNPFYDFYYLHKASYETQLGL